MACTRAFLVYRIALPRRLRPSDAQTDDHDNTDPTHSLPHDFPPSRSEPSISPFMSERNGGLKRDQGDRI